MTKKHFKAIAEAMHSIKPLEHEEPYLDAWYEAIGKLADVCMASNPRFNINIFQKACEEGLSYDLEY